MAKSKPPPEVQTLLGIRYILRLLTIPPDVRLLLAQIFYQIFFYFVTILQLYGNRQIIMLNLAFTLLEQIFIQCNGTIKNDGIVVLFLVKVVFVSMENSEDVSQNSSPKKEKTPLKTKSPISILISITWI